MTLPDPPKRKGRPMQPETSVKSVRLPLDLWEALEGLPGSTYADKLSSILPVTHARAKKPSVVLYTDGTWKKSSDKA